MLTDLATVLAPYLPLIMAVILAVGIAIYVLLDGFDLGIGIMFPFAPTDHDRTLMINAIAPVWDGNETWLVLGIGGFMIMFPAAQTVVMTALYAPMMLMLFALIFRGVAFEFRAKSQNPAKWNVAFATGSFFAAFMQGVVLGAFIQSLPVAGEKYGAYVYAGSALDWLTPFSLMAGLALACGYTLLGACWVVSKAEGALQDWAASVGRLMLLGVALFTLIVSIWTPLAQPDIAARWFGNNGMNFVMLLPVPLVSLYFTVRLWLALGQKKPYQPFLYTAGLFLLSFFGLGISLWPYAVPRSLTIYQAAAAPESLTLILIGVILVLPLVLFYTGYVYKIFWGKVRLTDGPLYGRH